MNNRLNRDQAQGIIDRVAAGESQKKLAAEMGVTPSTVSSIVNGRTWPSLARPERSLVVLRGATLTEVQVREVLVRLSQGEKDGSVAVDYGVTRVTISNIRRGKTWSHVPRPEVEKRQRRRVWED